MSGGDERSTRGTWTRQAPEVFICILHVFIYISVCYLSETKAERKETGNRMKPKKRVGVQTTRKTESGTVRHLESKGKRNSRVPDGCHGLSLTSVYVGGECVEQISAELCESR